MSYALVWIEILVCALLWTAASAGWAARRKRPWAKAALRIGLLLVPAFILFIFVVWAAALKFVDNLENNWFGYSLSLLLCTLAGMIVILRQARRPAPGLAPAARQWRIGTLSLSALAVAAVLGMTIWNIEITLGARINLLALEAHTTWEAEQPALVSDDQNAAPLYEEALARLRDDPAKDVQNPPLGNHETFDPREPATIEYLARNQKTLALLRQAAKLPVFRLDQELLDFNAVFPQLNEYRNAADVLALDAQYQVSRANAAAAIDDVQAICGFAGQVGQRPLFVSALVALGMDAEGTQQLQAVLPAVRRQEDLAGLHLQSGSFIRRIMYRGIQSDKWYGLDQFRDGFTGTGNRSPFPFLMLPDEVDAYLQVVDDVSQAVLEPYVTAKDRLAGIEETYGPHHRHKGLMAAILAPSLARIAITAARVEAGDACAQLAVAMTRYRLDRGVLPGRLDAVVPAYLDAIPLDPFSGQPLKLAVGTNQWIVYSVGPDGVDDGGVNIDPHGKGDVIFTLKSAASPTTVP